MDIKQFVKKYSTDFGSLLNSLEATEGTDKIAYEIGIEKAVELVRNVQSGNKKIMMIGNGGSAGIASHQAVDYWKNGKVRAIAFNDSSLLTCISNDFSYAEVFSRPIEAFADTGDIVFCISSSGSSKNILNAAEQAKKSGCTVVTFSGFRADNPLRKMGDLNFYLPSHSYGYVEILHLFIIHCILDAKLYCLDKADIFNKNNPL
ncbi:MAG: SIS domain-containing protein [Bacteroidetes bacterium]|nr:MAG: SIS domain-containing protein [Bacteroidota bacterium]